MFFKQLLNKSLKLTSNNNIKKLLYCKKELIECFKFYCQKISEKDELDTDLTAIIKEEDLENLVPRSVRVTGTPHQVYIVHPHIKWGKYKSFISTPQLKLDEAISLIKTLPGWAVVDTRIISATSFNKKTFFNSGQLESVKEVLKNEKFTALFINTMQLKLPQIIFLEGYLDIPVFDRYSIIINIFKDHAHTKEAKLQVALAEIPYIYSRIRGIHENEGIISKNVGISSQETFIDKRVELLNDKRRKVTQAIDDLRKQRHLLRNKRKTLDYPIIAIVGYTNVGKTSLIKSLTADSKLKPENKLFATLDVTAHALDLPYNIKTLLMDTIGFISDIPTNLLEPFVATLEDALLADVIIHIIDISHPDCLAQQIQVMETLKKLKISENVINNIITVGNKCDKCSEIKLDENKQIHLISCKTNQGLDQLKWMLTEAVIKAKNMIKIRIRVKNGGIEYQWLLKESAVMDILVDKNPQYALLDVFITQTKFNKFKHDFT